MIGYQVRQVDLIKEKESVVELWNNNFNSNTDFKYKYKWLYSHNPFGPASLYFLLSDESSEPIGIQGFSHRILYLKGEYYTASLVADFAVNANHRTLGPGLLLLKHVLKSGLQSDDIVYSFPNNKAVPVVKRAGYKLAVSVTRFSKVIKSKKYLEDRLPRSLAVFAVPILDTSIMLVDYVGYLKAVVTFDRELVSRAPHEIDQLWEASTFKEECLLTKRNKSYIDWRMSEDANKKASFFIFRRKNTAHLTGYISFYYDEINRVIDVLDFFAIDANVTLRMMFKLFAVDVRKFDVSAISVEYKGNRHMDHVLESTGFRARESRSVYYMLNKDIEKEFKSNEWFITSWDEDAL